MWSLKPHFYTRQLCTRLSTTTPTIHHITRVTSICPIHSSIAISSNSGGLRFHSHLSQMANPATSQSITTVELPFPTPHIQPPIPDPTDSTAPTPPPQIEQIPSSAIAVDPSSTITSPTVVDADDTPVDTHVGPMTRQDFLKFFRDYAHAALKDAADKRGVRPTDLLTTEKQPSIESGKVSLHALTEQFFSEGDAIQQQAKKYQEQFANLRNSSLHQKLPIGQRLMVEWYGPMVAAVRETQDDERLFNRVSCGIKVGPFMNCLPAEELTVVVLHTLIGELLKSPYGVKYVNASLALGSAIEREARIHARRDREHGRKIENKIKRFENWKNQDESLLVKSGQYLTPTSELDPAAGAEAKRIPGGRWNKPNKLSTRRLAAMTRNLEQLKLRASGVYTAAWTKEIQAHIGSLFLGVACRTIGLPQDIIALTPTQEENATIFQARTNVDKVMEDVWKDVKSNDMKLIESVIPPSLRDVRVQPPVSKDKPKFVPAIYHFYRRSNETDGRHPLQVQSMRPYAIGMIRADSRIIRVFLEDPDVSKNFLPKLNPMLIPPKPWFAFDEGGYLTVKHNLVRGIGSSDKQILKHASIPRILDGLNYLASTPWTVNPLIYHVAMQLWEDGGGVADLPERKDKELPKPPPRGSNQPFDKKEYDKIKQHNSELHSQRCDLQYKFNAAKECLGKTIYYPYFLDFRGRAYPLPPYLNHTSGDLSRGLLKFAVSRPLGPMGLKNLMIHTATVFGGGIDKQSLDARADWCLKAMDQIGSTVNAPLIDRWWLKADKPFQFLAAASELVAAFNSPNPEQFQSSLPIHTDGSCNGLQHYAALGRDAWGGACVNLTPHDKPQDVYTQVLEIVKGKLLRDAMDPKNPKLELANKLMKCGINRKVVKQAVMTSVYGVTLIGARDQILARLKEMPEALKILGAAPATPGAPDLASSSQPKIHYGEHVELFAAAMYLSQLTLNSLYDAFSSAKSIQNWLGDCSQLLSAVQQPVSWVTPLGLPVIQPYRALSTSHVSTGLLGLQKITLHSDEEDSLVSSTRQKSAFPPNYIHSLDASHMLLTAAACQRRGLTFASVHDSFWTHAGTMNELSSILRQQFVDLYSQPILEQTRDAWCRQYPEIVFPPVPKRGDLDLNLVLKSPYFFN